MSEVKSKVPGVVDEVKAAEGDKIETGQVVIVLEAMKMKMPVASPESGLLKRLAV
ncbi:acetyl-CoA carboxylase biotin carboxyl carrier protein subunit, partial [Klebsiella oxytoca]|uniref:acetyl-CoA carboxylase biotin carboxyl carrier protein subunit n=2 Tax=Klebsiella/Raoultella group TaxID=2890311 RepID=UPI001CC95DC6